MFARRTLLALLTLPALAAAADGFDSPESAVQDPTSKSIYVSNVAGNPMAKDGNGYISRLGADGKLEEVRFLPTRGQPRLHAPKGLALTGRTLWVTDIDRVVGYDLRSRKQVKVYDLSKQGAKFLNDLAVLPNGRLLITDTATDTVWSLDTSKGAAEIMLRGVTGGANGVFVDPATEALTVVPSPIDFQTKAQVHRFEVPAGKPFRLPTTVSSEGGIYDGVAIVDGTLYVSDWARGAILSVDANGRMSPVVSGLNGPADFGVTSDGKQLIVVEFGGNAVKLHDLSASAKVR